MEIKNIKDELSDENITELITKTLTNYPATRSSDTLLFIRCCRELGATYVSDIPLTGLNVQSVPRIRRMIQADHPELCATEEVKKARNMRETQAIDYFRGEQ